MSVDFAETIRSIGGITPHERYALATLLAAACEYGGGDALSGTMLANMSPAGILKVAETLRISEPPRVGGATGAMLLLRCKSEDPRIAEMLQDLNCRSTSAIGCGWEWVGSLKPTAEHP